MTQEGVALEVGEALSEAEIAWPKKARGWGAGEGRVGGLHSGLRWKFVRETFWQLWVQGKRSTDTCWYHVWLQPSVMSQGRRKAAMVEGRSFAKVPASAGASGLRVCSWHPAA